MITTTMNKTRQFVPWNLVAAASIVLAACTGAETSTGSNGTGSTPQSVEPAVASGPLTGLGPLGLAGASLEDGATQVLVNVEAVSTARQLRLGMTANLNGQASSTTGSGQAFGAVAESVVRGPATSVDTAANRLVVLNTPVRVDQNTLLEGANSLGEVAVGDEVEVFGLGLPGNQGKLATRLIIRRPVNASPVEVLGVISELSNTALVIDGIRVDLTNAQFGNVTATGVAFTPTTNVLFLSPGVLIRVIGTYNAGTGVLSATKVAASFAPARPEGNLIFIEGFVSELLGTTRFKLQDLEIEAQGVPAAAGSIAVGTRVRVRGKMQQGVLKADAIGTIDATTRTQFVIEGEVAAFASTASFEVRGEKIDASQAVYSNGTAADLLNGKRVRVKGFAGPGRIAATELSFIN